jgi:hypothetical protein
MAFRVASNIQLRFLSLNESEEDAVRSNVVVFLGVGCSNEIVRGRGKSPYKVSKTLIALEGPV